MNILGFGRAARGTAVACAAAFAVMGAAPAFAASPTYNDARISIQGGGAASLSGCLNYARTSARHQVRPQSNYCRNVADAYGGTVYLHDVSLFLDQENNQGGRTYNKATVNISGGDSSAVAACVNYVQGTATPSQVNTCRNNATSYGGSVTLDNVDVTVVQSAN
ncbi:hypothetical protein [Frankia sp. R82]|uniref:hypothetical protein n=1 Tax=Frankia sp. R82 TaxID=2950553 RepID=UPI0020436615|nr:hypothetical protein [Frankia sp. R82]MCM3882250.1 hypothetical protein [Frankia sp. R82]